MSTTLGVSALGTYPLAGTFARAKPTVTVTAPSGTISDTQPTATWTYTSTVSRAQYSYQIQVRSQDGVTVLFDTGTVVGAGTSALVGFNLSGGSSYQMWVRTSDGYDTSAWATSNFSSSASSVADYPDETRVGSVFEVGVNGVGYMLADDPERPVQRRVAILEPQRLATSETPFAESIDRYSFIGASDWSGGAGQKFRNRDDSDPTRYWDSEGINPFDEEWLCLLNGTVQSQADTYTKPYTVVASGLVFTASADGELTSQTTPEGTETTFTITGGGAPTDMASDGINWYYADGADIFRNSSAADPVTAWSTVNADRIEWIIDRLFAVYDNGTGDLCVSDLTNAGAEEVSGGRFLYPDTVSIPSLTGGDGYAWFVVNRDDVSQVHYWQVASSDTYAAVGLTLPAGQFAQAIGFYLGSVFVFATEELDAGGYRAIIYQCAASEGRLIPSKVTDFTLSAVPTNPGFAGDDRFVVFSWTGMTEADSYSGVGCVNLDTGGYSKWFSTTATGEVFKPAVWNGKVCVPVAGSGLWVEGESPVSSGWIESSISDLASSLSKVIDEIGVYVVPLPASGTIAMEYTIDSGNSYTSAGTTVSSAGATEGSWETAVRSQSIGYRLTLGASATSPCVSLVQVKLHPLALPEQILVLPVNCSDTVAGLNGQTIRYDQSGIERVRSLEALVGSRVKVQDTDWPVTQTSLIWEMVNVETVLTGVYDRNLNRRSDVGVAEITLRRAL